MRWMLPRNFCSDDSLILNPRLTSWAGFAEGITGFSDDFAVQVFALSFQGSSF